MDKENEVKDLERRIWDMLESERLENEEKTMEHAREWELNFKESQNIVKQISETLNPNKNTE